MIDSIMLGVIASGIMYMCMKMAIVNDVSHEIRDILNGWRPPPPTICGG